MVPKNVPAVDLIPIGSLVRVRAWENKSVYLPSNKIHSNGNMSEGTWESYGYENPEDYYKATDGFVRIPIGAVPAFGIVISVKTMSLPPFGIFYEILLQEKKRTLWFPFGDISNDDI